MEIIEFNNGNLPGISAEVLKALQENILKGIETHIKKTILLQSTTGLPTETYLNDSVDNYDLVIVNLGNVGNAVERQNRVIPICAGIYKDFFYLYANSNYNSAILVDLSNKSQIKLGVRNPVGWQVSDIKIFSVIGIKF